VVRSEARTVAKHVHGTYEASPDAPGRARILVGDALHRWAIVDDELRSTVVLLTSELVTNAIRHCQRRVEIHVHYEDAIFRVEVLDDSPLEPDLGATDPFAEKGRGLGIVSALASGWGALPDRKGKRVWFEVDAPDRREG
jgi:anti-sigma regulatory factor (Ser/Thr protein kinase)